MGAPAGATVPVSIGRAKSDISHALSGSPEVNNTPARPTDGRGHFRLYNGNSNMSVYVLVQATEPDDNGAAAVAGWPWRVVPRRTADRRKRRRVGMGGRGCDGDSVAYRLVMIPEHLDRYRVSRPGQNLVGTRTCIWRHLAAICGTVHAGCIRAGRFGAGSQSPTRSQHGDSAGRLLRPG